MATHGADRGPEDGRRSPRRRAAAYYKVKNPNPLPAIYIKETRLVSQSFVYEKKFQPQAASCRSGPTEKLRRPAAAAVRLRPHDAEAVAAGRDADRDAASSTTRTSRSWPTGSTAWARSVAFTSDARSNPPGKAAGTATGPAREMYVQVLGAGRRLGAAADRDRQASA